MESICEYELNLAKKQETKEEQDGLQLPSGFTRERQFYVEDEIQNMLTGRTPTHSIRVCIVLTAVQASHCQNSCSWRPRSAIY